VNREPEVDGAELPQVIVDAMARNADRILLPISSLAIPPGGEVVVEFTLSDDVPKFYIVAVVIREASEDATPWIAEILVDDQILERDLRTTADRRRAARWRAMSRPAGPGSSVMARIVNQGAETLEFHGGLLIASTEYGPED
jgi:hypothetical protein